MKPKRKTKPRAVVVRLRLKSSRKLECEPARIEVRPDDIISWRWEKSLPFHFGLVIKSPFSPLGRQFYATILEGSKTMEISARVLACAPPGTYPYLVAAFVDGKLLVEDPEIIVRPPIKGDG